ncbi:MAG: SIS domain-containing protein [Planctomycetes bacterium]|nr:SIS domain-containing protein [Planctomycetota bacterium]
MDFQETVKAILREITGVAAAASADEIVELAARLRDARRVFVAGAGRSGLVARMFAVRLSQMDFAVFVAGEPAAPPAGPGDLLVAVSGSGKTPVTRHFAEVAKAAGAHVAAVVGDTSSRLVQLADTVLVVPGKVKTGAGVQSIQMPGTLFEQAALVVLDTLVIHLCKLTGESNESMKSRHTNLE